MSTPFNEYWLEMGAVVPVDIETTATLLGEISRLRNQKMQPMPDAIHSSDCAVHSEPAYPAGECDCQDTAECLKSGFCLSQPEQPTLDVEATLEMFKQACKRLKTQNKRMRYLIERTYYIHEDGSLRQRLMDNLLADVARDVLENDL